MATDNVITQLIEQLTRINKTVCTSESQKRRVSKEAINAIHSSDLDEETRSSVISAISKASNPSGWYFESTGISAGLEALETLLVEAGEEVAVVVESKAQATTGRTRGINGKNLRNLVAGGAIFSVEFIKRTDGSLRKMVCRLGVKKHLKGGNKAYSAKQHNLLTVFDMENQGYRSIPIEAIQRLSVNGQSFNFAEV